GKPVSDLLVRELRTIKDSSLIEATYEVMNDFWELSSRKFDKTIKELFEAELMNRGLFNIQNDNQKENEIQNDIQINNENDNHNDNQESCTTIRENIDDTQNLDRYIEYLNNKNPFIREEINMKNILRISYEVLI